MATGGSRDNAGELSVTFIQNVAVYVVKSFLFFSTKVFDRFLQQATADNIIEALEYLREPDDMNNS